jgi:hypothetical protein
MTVKEYVAEALEMLDETELRQLAEYVAFLKFRTRLSMLPSLDTTKLGALYAQFADEDLMLAEAGLAEYNASLIAEDTL